MLTTPNQLSVLLVEDDEDDYVITRDLLAGQSRTRFDLEWIPSYEDALAAIGERRHDVYLIDYRLGEFTGLDLVREAFGAEGIPPVIMLTGHGDYEVDLEATLLGVTDFLVKDQLDTALLERSIRYAVRHHATLAELRKSQERYALAVRGANDGTWDWDLDSERIYVSPRWKAMLGYEEDAVGDSPQEWLERVHPDDLGRLEEAIDAHLRGETAHLESEHRILSREGTFRWVLIRGVAIRDPSGEATRMAGSMTDITEHKAAEEQLLYDALHDTLTGLPNRALFIDRLTHSLARCKREPDHRCAVLFLDVDRFKLVNDGFSHGAGDELLITLARRLTSQLRPSDTVARMGGDEFTILLDGVGGGDEPAQVAERIQQAVGRPFRAGGHELVVTASIGISMNEPGSGPAELMRNADIAMYDAKRKGGARHAVFNASMHSRVVSQVQLERQLRQVIDERRLRVFYQPIIEIQTGRLSGFEALARWPEGEPQVPPLEFIALAEAVGLIGSLGRLVLDEACSTLNDWRQRGLIEDNLTISVNVSGRQFGESDLAQAVVAALERNALPGEALRLEITESSVMYEPEHMHTTLEHLQRVGVRAQIDDFGTGYSSLTFLHHFHGDALKIDRSFISSMQEDADAEAIVKAVIALGKSLDLHVIAEGVESQDQLDHLRGLGCEYAQGYLLSEPMDAAGMERLIVEWSGRGAQALATNGDGPSA